MIRLITIAFFIGLLVSLSACAGSGQPSVRYSVGFGSYYGAGPWGYYGHPIYIGGGEIPDEPIATPLPDFGPPDMGGMGDFADFDY